MTLQRRVESVERRLGPANRSWREMTAAELAHDLIAAMGRFPDANLDWTFDEQRRLRDMREALDAAASSVVAEMLKTLVRQYWVKVPGFAVMFSSIG